MKMYIFRRDRTMDIIVEEYNSEEELEELYEEYDDSPLIGGTLFLTEEEFKFIMEWGQNYEHNKDKSGNGATD